MLAKKRKHSDYWYFIPDIMELCVVKETKAGGLIRQWNKELRELGYTTIDGQVPQKYAREKLYIE